MPWSACICSFIYCFIRLSTILECLSSSRPHRSSRDFKFELFDNAAGHPRRGSVFLFSEQQHSDWRNTALAIEPAIGDAIIGQQPLIRLINIALFARGHVLLEGDVGVGKTTVLRAFARAVGGDRLAPIPRTDAEGRVIGFWQAQDVVQQSNHSTKQSGEELSRLHDDHLIRLEQLANLTYVKLDSPHTLSDAVRDAGFSTIKSVPIDLRWFPATLALLALGCASCRLAEQYVETILQ